MPKFVIDQDFSTEYKIVSSAKTWVFTQGIEGESATEQVIHEQQGVADSHIIINAHLDNDGDIGILAEGDKTELTIGKAGWIDAYHAVKMTGLQQSIVNNGLVTGENIGILANGAGTHIVNNGTIGGMIPIAANSAGLVVENNGMLQGMYGMIVEGEGAKILLGEKSFISAHHTAVEFHGHDGEHMRLVNRGYMAASEDRAITALGSDNTVINRGEMRGAVSFGDGDDVFDTRGGKFVGTVYGADGDDTYVTDTAKLHIFESDDRGTDTVKSTVSIDFTKGTFATEYLENIVLIGKADTNATGNDQYNSLTGNAGDNRLDGNEGIDFLRGGKGNDLLIGGTGTDFFAFKTGDGHDVIQDFSVGLEQIDISGWKAIKDFDDLMAHHLHKDGADLVITAGSDSLRLEDFKLGDLEATDFQY